MKLSRRMKLKLYQLFALAAFCFLANPGQSSEVKTPYVSKINDYRFIVSCAGWKKDADVIRCDFEAMKVCPGQYQLSRYEGGDEISVAKDFEFRVEKKMVVTCL